MPYREAEEQIRYCAPARYLCGLTETDRTPDFTTIWDFAQLLGEDGLRLINEAVVKQAVALGLADPKVAVADMTVELHATMATMGKLIPQIRHWLRTGFVAAGKIINLHIPQVYSIVRGKVGKSVEFGLSWGITRLRGGFVLATMAGTKTEFTDSSYAVTSGQGDRSDRESETTDVRRRVQAAHHEGCRRLQRVWRSRRAVAA